MSCEPRAPIYTGRPAADSHYYNPCGASEGKMDVATRAARLHQVTRILQPKSNARTCKTRAQLALPCATCSRHFLVAILQASPTTVCKQFIRSHVQQYLSIALITFLKVPKGRVTPLFTPLPNFPARLLVSLIGFCFLPPSPKAALFSVLASRSCQTSPLHHFNTGKL